LTDLQLEVNNLNNALPNFFSQNHLLATNDDRKRFQQSVDQISAQLRKVEKSNTEFRKALYSLQ